MCNKSMKHFIPFDLAIPRPCRFPKEITQKQSKITKVFAVRLFMDRGKRERERERNTLNAIHMPNTRGMAKPMMVTVILCHWKRMSF